MAILFVRTPTCLIEEHVKDVPLFFGIDRVKLLVKIAKLEETLRNEVVFDALVLKVTVHSLDQFKVCQSEAHKLIRSLVLVESHDKGPIESIVAK